jgi:hypothetical protein
MDRRERVARWQECEAFCVYGYTMFVWYESLWLARMDWAGRMGPLVWGL